MYEQSKTNYQLSHIRTKNQQSHVTTNYQISNAYINVIEQIVCCILKWRVFIFTVIAKDIVAVVFAEYLVAWMTHEFQFLIELVSFLYVWRRTKNIFYAHVTSSSLFFIFDWMHLFIDWQDPFYLHHLVDSYSIWWIVSALNTG